VTAHTVDAHRVIVGHCPNCHAILLITNDYEAWPLARCACGWHGGTTAIVASVRLDCTR